MTSAPPEPDLLGFLAVNRLFRGFPDAALDDLARTLETRLITEGEILFREGDPADGLYLVRSGHLAVILEWKGLGQERALVGPGDSVGVIQDFRGALRSATVRAAADSELLLLTPDAYRDLLQRHPDPFRRVGRSMAERVHRIHFDVIMRLNPLFADLGEKILAEIERAVEIRDVPSGTFLFRQNDPSDALYIVISGRLRIWQQQPGSNVFLNEVGQGGSVGEAGVITGNPRAADVKAIRDTVYARLDADELMRLLDAYPRPMNRLFVRMMQQHLGDPGGAPAKPVNSTSTFALVPVGPGVPIRDAGEALARALSRIGSTLALNSDMCDSRFGVDRVAQAGFDDPVNGPLLEWLNQQEFSHQFMVYVADGTFSNWTRRCVRQADHVLFVAEARGAPELGPVEERVLREENVPGLRKSLVLLQEPGTEVPSGTLAWLNARKIGMHHHVRKGSDTDFGRLARFLTGKAVALVLGGGGARGFAHVGVMRAMNELGIPIDLVAGTSMGALIASQCAMQWSPDEILQRTLALCLAGEQVTIPMVSVFAGARFIHGVRRLMQGAEIEDMWRNFFAVSCNLSRASVVVHDKGPLQEAVLASNTPPGLFPPRVDHGDLLVDGALLNNLPADIMQRYNEGGEMIAVDVSPREDLLANTEYKDGLSGVKVLMSKINPFAAPMHVPNIVDIITRSTAIGGLAQKQRVMQGIADVYLKPPVAKYAIMGYSDGPEIADIGYDDAMRSLEDWLTRRQRADAA
ncbi:MAG: cyclic nucleotide-binding domain-containing protein [Hyphomicrobiales bacterium]|nr:cyclic nucleotide-binding domain-containing protein [Hyphomicrobiales bacterium]